jgi:hypothetical protein
MHASCKVRGVLIKSLKTSEHIAPIDEEKQNKKILSYPVGYHFNNSLLGAQTFILGSVQNF